MNALNSKLKERVGVQVRVKSTNFVTLGSNNRCYFLPHSDFGDTAHNGQWHTLQITQLFEVGAVDWEIKHGEGGIERNWTGEDEARKWSGIEELEYRVSGICECGACLENVGWLTNSLETEIYLPKVIMIVKHKFFIFTFLYIITLKRHFFDIAVA